MCGSSSARSADADSPTKGEHRPTLVRHRAHGFKVFVASAGGRDFMRAVSEEIYGVPRESVIGSSAVLEWSEGRVLRTAALAQPLDDGPGKPVHIYDRLGLPPALAAGNADGDIQLLELAKPTRSSAPRASRGCTSAGMPRTCGCSSRCSRSCSSSSRGSWSTPTSWAAA